MEANSAASDSFRPCECPRLFHKVCLARWCLQQAGKLEEKTCRFCNGSLPDWKSSLTPHYGLQTVVPKMGIISNNGKRYLVDVEPGEAGRDRFIAEVRRLLKLSPEQKFDVKFECSLPSSAARIDLDGLTAYDAAVFCAALKAAERMKNAE